MDNKRKSEEISSSELELESRPPHIIKTKKVLKPLPPNYTCKICGQVDDHAVFLCPQKIKKKYLEDKVENPPTRADNLKKLDTPEGHNTIMSIYIAGLPFDCTREKLVMYLTGGKDNQPAKEETQTEVAVEGDEVEEDEEKSEKKLKKEKKRKEKEEAKAAKKAEKDAEKAEKAEAAGYPVPEAKPVVEEEDDGSFICHCTEKLTTKRIKLVMFDDNTKKCKGIGFVRLSSEGDMEKCLEANGVVFHDRIIKITRVLPSDNDGKRKACYRCGKMHDPLTCSNPRICYRCKSTSHISSDCPLKKN